MTNTTTVVEEAPVFFTIPEAGAWLEEQGRYHRIPNPVTMRRWISEGRFPNAQRDVKGSGKPWQIPLEDLEAFETPTRGRPTEEEVEGEESID